MSERFRKIKSILSDPVFWIIVAILVVVVFLMTTGIIDLTDLVD